MSKVFVKAEAAAEYGTFASLLPMVDQAHPDLKPVRGRTAESLEKLREAARMEGRQEGYVEGLSEGQKEAFEASRVAHEAAVAAFRVALDEKAASLDDAMKAWYAAAEENLASLAVAIAAQVLGRELETSKDAVTHLAREAIQAVANADKVRIRVNPFDSELIAAHKALILAAGPTVRGVEIVDDPSIEGGVKIESDAGLIDATIRTQLELAFEALRRDA